MDDYSYAAISEMLGTYPTNINSELVSGQLRKIRIARREIRVVL